MVPHPPPCIYVIFAPSQTICHFLLVFCSHYYLLGVTGGSKPACCARSVLSLLLLRYHQPAANLWTYTSPRLFVNKLFQPVAWTATDLRTYTLPRLFVNKIFHLRRGLRPSCGRILCQGLSLSSFILLTVPTVTSIYHPLFQYRPLFHYRHLELH